MTLFTCPTNNQQHHHLQSTSVMSECAQRLHVVHVPHAFSIMAQASLATEKYNLRTRTGLF